VRELFSQISAVRYGTTISTVVLSVLYIYYSGDIKRLRSDSWLHHEPRSNQDTSNLTHNIYNLFITNHLFSLFYLIIYLSFNDTKEITPRHSLYSLFDSYHDIISSYIIT
jgi:hypothetical protein